MKVAILSKNPYCMPGSNIKPYLAGHCTGFVQPFINYLLSNGNEVTLIAPHEEYIEPSNTENFCSIPEINSFQIILVKEKVLPKVPFYYGSIEVQAAIVYAKELMNGLDVVLVVYVFPWIVAVNDLKTKLGFRTIAFLRGSDVFSGCSPDSTYRDHFENNLWECYRKLVIDSINLSDSVFSVSEMLKSFASNIGIRVDHVSPTPPFVGESYVGNKKDFKQRFHDLGIISPDVDSKWILFLGRFHIEKQPDLVIKAFQNLKGKANLILGGLGEEKNTLEKMIGILNLANIFICFVPPKHVQLLCNSADIMIHPTTPNAFLDARPSTCMNGSFAGLPIVFPFSENILCSGLNETVSKLNTQLLAVNPCLEEPRLVEAFREKMEILLSNEFLCNKIGMSNKRFASQFHPDILFPEILKVIRDDK